MAFSAWLAAVSDRGTLSTLVLVLVGVYLLQTLRQYYRLRKFKGPWMAAWSKWWLIRSTVGGRSHLDLWEVTRRHGSIARIGPNDLVTSDPQLMKHISGVKTEYRRSDWYEALRFNPAANNIVSWRDETEHSRIRSIMASGYNGRDIANLETKIDRNILAFCRLLREYAMKGQRVDLGRKVQFFTLDVISDLSLEKPFGFMEADSDVYNYIKLTEKNFAISMFMALLPWLVRLLRLPVFRHLLSSPNDSVGFGKAISIAKDVAAGRFGPDRKVQKDMIGSFVAHGLTKKELESEIVFQILAGSDTTATAIRSTILHIISSPRVLSKLRAEIADARPSNPITDTEARKMPYLQAVIKEGLRIFPPVTALMPKEAPPKGHMWNGKFIPGGTRVGYCMWGIFRQEDIWGSDAAEFRPERWLDGDEGSIKAMEATLELAFSYGRWQCLGKSIALIELNKVFVQLLREFDITVCDPTKPWKSSNFGLFSQSEFWVRVTPAPID